MSQENKPNPISVFNTQVIWAQVDANGHMRHSAYADIAAQARVNALEEAGMSLKKFHEWHLGPVLFREELKYFREVHLNDILKVTCELLHASNDMSRWTIYHEVYRSDGVKAASITVDGTWIDTKKRKMTGLTGDLLDLFLQMPKAKDFSID